MTLFTIRNGKWKGIYQYIDQLIYCRVYINMSDISGETYGKIIQKDRSPMYRYKYNKIYYLVDLDVQPVCLVIFNQFRTAFVYTVTF